MPLQKLQFRPGVNREGTTLSNEGGWFDCDKVRFRSGYPEKIGGWQRISSNTFLGVCRSLWNWVTLSALNLIGVGTNLKFYINRGGAYFDVTPIRTEANLSNPFTASVGSPVISVHAVAHGCVNNDYVTFNGATSLGGTITASLLNREYQITYVDVDNYIINVGTNANSSDTGHGGTVRAVYQINTGPAYQAPLTGWGAGPWGYGTWGNGQASNNAIRLWSQSNYGQNLIFGPRGGSMYLYEADKGLSSIQATITIASPAVVTSNMVVAEYSAIELETSGALPTGLETGTIYYVRNYNSLLKTFNLSATPTGALINTSGTQSGTQYISARAINLASQYGASDVPTVQNYIFVSDIYRFVFAFGCNDYGSTTQDPLLMRWSDQEDATMWTPSVTNQAGSLRLSHGSAIITALQTRQEIVVWTDTSLYSIQYLGPPYVWNAQLMGDNTSIVGQNATALASGVVYWMGVDKFYKYDGRVQTLRCDLRAYVFNDFNSLQSGQVYCGTNEGFNEVWWFYCSANSTTIDKYVVYNYVEDIWYYGTMTRTAWLDSGLQPYPLAATLNNRLTFQENGVDDNTSGTPVGIDSYITSSQFDIGDGHTFGFVWRLIPDITFRGSSATNPQVTMTLQPAQNSGSGYNVPESVGGSSNAAVVRTATVPIEEFTGQVYTRIRGRQMAFRIESAGVGTAWQLGAPRIDIRNDGRR